MDMKWSAIAEEEEAGSSRTLLPPNSRVELDEKGRFLERKYWVDEETGHMKMSERYALKTLTTKRVAKTAIARKSRWQKFGEVKGQRMGVTEAGITSRKAQPTELQWVGGAQRRKKKKVLKPPPRVTAATVELEESKKSSEISGKRRFEPRRESSEEKFEVKISNLPPNWGVANGEKDRDKNNAARDAIRELVNAFYENHLQKRPPRRYRIKVWTDKRGGVHAAVEFDSESDRNKAIDILDGHTYGHRALSVVKSQPRPRY